MDENEQHEIPLVWENVEGVPVLFANQFIIQHLQDEFVLTVGQMVRRRCWATNESAKRNYGSLRGCPSGLWRG